MFTCTKKYDDYDDNFKGSYQRRTINGKKVNCGQCVGYCSFEEHPGFLTKELRQEHDCLKKGCWYYRNKENMQKTKSKETVVDTDNILKIVRLHTEKLEGFRAIRVAYESGRYVVYYITISNEYSISDIEKAVMNCTRRLVLLKALPYDFDVCAQLILAG